MDKDNHPHEEEERAPQGDPTANRPPGQMKGALSVGPVIIGKGFTLRRTKGLQATTPHGTHHVEDILQEVAEERVEDSISPRGKYTKMSTTHSHCFIRLTLQKLDVWPWMRMKIGTEADRVPFTLAPGNPWSN